MTQATHPAEALFKGDKPFPVLSACEHFAGSEKLILKAMDLQKELGAIFDITCDCEDGAAAGNERPHAELVARLINSERNAFNKAGVRIHDPTHPSWKQDVDVVVGQAAARLAYVTIPKSTSTSQVEEVIAHVQRTARAAGSDRAIPIHVLIETHGALEAAFRLAALPHVEVLDFGQMDFVSGHHGAIPAAAMRSPAQFDHALLVRAKSQMVAAALSHGVVPAHNVCLNLKDDQVVHADAFRARTQFGFLRMWSIHPAQIRPIVDAMKPSFDEVQDAGEILCAAQDAQWGPIQYKGELHDRATYRYFWSVLERAQATGIELPPKPAARFFAA
ncbi:aldolase/citrate lyase family protein [Variovorax defluvii]|uniref:Aldolase/citrate lyase family protein n=1 Tax=Variovorax defluvii TaxID=913761 RepID=A0ABP8I950_9BURK